MNNFLGSKIARVGAAVGAFVGAVVAAAPAFG